jgi:hypothetical protein
MSTVYHSAPVTEVLARLDAHTATHGLLDGLDWESLLVTTIDGKMDLPRLRIMVPEGGETYAPPCAVFGTFNLNFLLSTARDAGIVSWLDWMDRIKDAIETHATSGVYSGDLGGLLLRVPEWRFSGVHCVENGLAIHGSIYMDMTLMPRSRLARAVQ